MEGFLQFIEIYRIPLALGIGFILDWLLGDPRGFPHPVRGMGWLISFGEGRLRKRWPDQERACGAVLVIAVVLMTAAVSFTVLFVAGRISPYFALGVESLMAWQVLAARSLKRESMKVWAQVAEGDLPKARKALSMIVGRDTEHLSMEQVIKATVETVAENLSDGVIAPLLFFALGGGVFGLCYKAINTLDSMIGYKSERYLLFGRTAARLDDGVNWIPARISAVLMILAAFFLGFDGRGGLRIYIRDRYNHASPNSAHTEAVCAGALGIQLSGDAYYFGRLYEKPTIGDRVRSVCDEDIRRANRLMYGTSVLGLIVGVAISTVIYVILPSLFKL